MQCESSQPFASNRNCSRPLTARVKIVGRATKRKGQNPLGERQLDCVHVSLQFAKTLQNSREIFCLKSEYEFVHQCRPCNARSESKVYSSASGTVGLGTLKLPAAPRVYAERG